VYLKKFPNPTLYAFRESENENDKVSFFNCATAPSALKSTKHRQMKREKNLNLKK
jgi:hypothetical protein